jgi:hypothetical protein
MPNAHSVCASRSAERMKIMVARAEESCGVDRVGVAWTHIFLAKREAVLHRFLRLLIV